MKKKWRNSSFRTNLQIETYNNWELLHFSIFVGEFFDLNSTVTMPEPKYAIRYWTGFKPLVGFQFSPHKILQCLYSGSNTAIKNSNTADQKPSTTNYEWNLQHLDSNITIIETATSLVQNNSQRPYNTKNTNKTTDSSTPNGNGLKHCEDIVLDSSTNLC